MGIFLGEPMVDDIADGDNVFPINTSQPLVSGCKPPCPSRGARLTLTTCNSARVFSGGNVHAFAKSGFQGKIVSMKNLC